ncbi:DNA polymerase III subunit gamma/tau [Myxococcus stipitatus]|uniref:DNA polymerase III subunit gamma/tau n=1 Tax=Myxococcus stipitatus TaxID=83455 RepID=UPI00314509E0
MAAVARPVVSEHTQAVVPPVAQELPRDAAPPRYDDSEYVPEPPADIELPRHGGGTATPPGAFDARTVHDGSSPAPFASASMQPGATNGHAPSPGSAQPRSVESSPAAPVAWSPPAPPSRPPSGMGASYSAENPLPSGPVLEGLPASAARPLSFLRKGPLAAPMAPGPSAPAPSAPPPPVEPSGSHAGATPLSRTTEPAPTVRVINVRKPETPAAPPEPPPYDDEEGRFYPEEASPGGCASGECIPEPAAAAEPEPEPPPPPPVAAAPMPRGRDNPNLPLIERWRAAVETVKGTSLRHGTALANGRLMSMKAGEIILGFLPTAGLHRMTVSAAAGKATIDKLLAEHFGRPVKLSFQDVSADDNRAAPSLAERDAHSRATHEKNTESKVRNHAAIRTVLLVLGGEVEHIQIYEPERPSAASPTDTPIEAPDDSA